MVLTFSSVSLDFTSFQRFGSPKSCYIYIYILYYIYYYIYYYYCNKLWFKHGLRQTPLRGVTTPTWFASLTMLFVVDCIMMGLYIYYIIYYILYISLYIIYIIYIIIIYNNIIKYNIIIYYSVLYILYYIIYYIYV